VTSWWLAASAENSLERVPLPDIPTKVWQLCDGIVIGSCQLQLKMARPFERHVPTTLHSASSCPMNFSLLLITRSNNWEAATGLHLWLERAKQTLL
jgi:hypothetical protein